MSKKLLNIIFIFAVFCLFQSIASAQTSEAVEWVRVESDSGEFSVEMPSDFVYFYDKDGFVYDQPNELYVFSDMQMLNAAADKTVMSVEIYKVPSPKSYMNELIERQRLQGAKTEESKDGFTIKQFLQHKVEEFRTKKETEVNFVARFIASKSYVYVVTVANRGAQSEAATRFLSSIQLNQKPSSDTATKKVNLSTVKPVTIEQIGEMAEDQKKSDDTQTTKPIEKPENPVIFLTKPFAGYTGAARRALDSGKIRLRATFANDGRISKIGVVSSLPNGLLRSAFFAALRIKFIPQEKENELVSATKVVEYSFDIR